MGPQHCPHYLYGLSRQLSSICNMMGNYTLHITCTAMSQLSESLSRDRHSPSRTHFCCSFHFNSKRTRNHLNVYQLWQAAIKNNIYTCIYVYINQYTYICLFIKYSWKATFEICDYRFSPFLKSILFIYF